MAIIEGNDKNKNILMGYVQFNSLRHADPVGSRQNGRGHRFQQHLLQFSFLYEIY